MLHNVALHLIVLYVAQFGAVFQQFSMIGKPNDPCLFSHGHSIVLLLNQLWAPLPMCGRANLLTQLGCDDAEFQARSPVS